MFGAGPAVGWGVASHDLALPGALARALASTTGRGSDVDLAADPDLSIFDAAEEILARRLWRYEVIAVVLGVNDATRLTPLVHWKDGLTDLVAAIEQATPSRTRIVVTGVQPIRSIPVFDSVLGTVADQHSTSMNEISRGVCARSERTTFAPLTAVPAADPRRHREPAAYTQWARGIVQAIPPCWAEMTGEPQSASPDDPRNSEAARQRALDGMGIDPRLEPGLDRIVDIARGAFGTTSSILTVIDGERQWHKARTGIDMSEMLRSDAFCDFTIRSTAGMVVPDARLDPRFRDNQYVTGEPFIRFYAGFPIESPTGERIGALCVIDSDARPEAEVDMVYLRELAYVAQQELERLGHDRESQATDAPDEKTPVHRSFRLTPRAKSSEDASKGVIAAE